MKTKLTFAISTLICMLFAHKNIFAQGSTYKMNGNSNGDTNSVIGFTNAADFKVITNDTVRFVVKKNGGIVAPGQITTDSISVSRILPPEGDSIIKFGANTVSLNTAANRISWTAQSQFGGPCPVFGISAIRGLSIGNGNITAYGANSTAFGTNTRTGCNATNAIVMGAGTATLLQNNIANSFMIGFNSNIPTLFVGTSAGNSTSGSVGVGTTTPLTKFHVASATGFITTDPLAPAFPSAALPVTDGLVIANSSGTLYRKINFTGNANDVLRGNGTFGTPPAAANAWLLGGNNNTNNLNNILGTLNQISVRLFAGNIPRGIIDWSTGFWGIGNIAIPQAILHVSDGALLATGTIGSTPISGAGTRMMWIPDKSAFRAGTLDANGVALWDDINIGSNSLAIGANTEAKGNRSVALGGNSHATDIQSMSLGHSIEGRNQRSFIIGTGIQNGSATPTFINDITNSLMVGFDITYNSLDATHPVFPTFMVKGGPTSNSYGKVGVNTDAPTGNGLEINTTDASPTTTIGGKSGLRFSDLTSASTVGVSNGKVLTVNPSGDVYITTDAGAGATDNIQQTITAMQQELQTLKTKIAAMEKIFVAKN